VKQEAEQEQEDRLGSPWIVSDRGGMACNPHEGGKGRISPPVPRQGTLRSERLPALDSSEGNGPDDA